MCVFIEGSIILYKKYVREKQGGRVLSAQFIEPGFAWPARRRLPYTLIHKLQRLEAILYLDLTVLFFIIQDWNLL